MELVFLGGVVGEGQEVLPPSLHGSAAAPEKGSDAQNTIEERAYLDTIIDIARDQVLNEMEAAKDSEPIVKEILHAFGCTDSGTPGRGETEQSKEPGDENSEA